MKKSILNLLLISIIFCACLVYVRYLNMDMKNKVQVLTEENIKYREELVSSKSKFDNYKHEVETEKSSASRVRVGTYPIEELEQLDLNGFNKIMIVTHPDDEMIWGGGHLIEDDYFVVCVTCGMDDYRVKEFEKSMSDTGEKYVMLEYPRSVDATLNREFNWKATSYLTQDLQNIINLKKWDLIVTHNPEGEYGHKYHILTSQVVTSLVKGEDRDKFYYFGKWYSKDNLDRLNSDRLNEELYNKKIDITIGNYVSQKNALNYNYHMMRNENWIKYADWN